MDNTKLLQKRLIKIEKELSTCRTSVLQDGWQTQRFAKKSRKWDILAQRKMEIINQIRESPCPNNLVCQCHRAGVTGCLALEYLITEATTINPL